MLEKEESSEKKSKRKRTSYELTDGAPGLIQLIQMALEEKKASDQESAVSGKKRKCSIIFALI